MKKYIKKYVALAVALCTVLCTLFGFSFSVKAEDMYDEYLPYGEELLYGRYALSQMDNGINLVRAYDSVFRMVEKGEDSVVINTKSSVDDIELTVSELKVVFAAHRFDNPQQFWVEKYKYGFYSDDTVGAIAAQYNSSLMDAEKRSEFKAAAQQFVKDAGIEEEMSEYETALVLHDAVVEHITYDLEAANAYNAYGALIDGRAVCEGYAELYQYLLYLCGMQAHIVTGNAGGAHAWNLVRIDGEYYMCDPTWDDQDPSSYGFYNLTTELLVSTGREIDDNGYELPLCIATRASYFNNSDYGGRFFKNEPSAENAVTQIKYYGAARFSYNGDESYSFEQFSEWCNVYGDYILREVNGEGLYAYTFGNEFGLVCVGNALEPIPRITSVPRLTAVAINTAVSIVLNETIGPVAVCPSAVGGERLTTSMVYELLNNERIEFESKEEGFIGTGSKIKIEDEEALIAVQGDIDGDGKITVFDALFVRRSVDAQNEEDRFTVGRILEKIAADMNGDGNADASDALSILKKAVGN